MLTTMIILFLVGYLMIALEHPLKINKAGTALLLGTILWVMYSRLAPLPTIEQELLHSVGEIAETLIARGLI